MSCVQTHIITQLLCVSYDCTAREEITRDEHISYTSHRIFHLQSFYDFMKTTFQYKCTKCNDQKGLKWVENHKSGLKTGHTVVFNIHCDNPKCNTLLYKNYQTSPRVTVMHNPKDEQTMLKIRSVNSYLIRIACFAWFIVKCHILHYRSQNIIKTTSGYSTAEA